MTRRTLLGGMMAAVASISQPAWARQAFSLRGRRAGDARRRAPLRSHRLSRRHRGSGWM